MTITMFNNNSPVNTIEKKLTNPKEVANVVLKEECNVISPIIELEIFNGWSNFNYIQIPVFNRYYFIEDVTLIDGHRLRYTLNCDVLMSFKTDILNSVGVIERSTSKNNTMLHDSVTAPWVSGKYTFKMFSPSEFTEISADNNSFVLITLGGAVNGN